MRGIKVTLFLSSMVLSICGLSQTAFARHFPWPGGQTAVSNQGFHDPASGGYAIDFVIQGNPDVVATEAGTAYAITESYSAKPGYCQAVPGSVWNNPLRYVRVDLADGRKLYFYHLSSSASNLMPNGPGVSVTQGQKLGTMGNSGCVAPQGGGTGIHLHYFEKKEGVGVPIDKFEGKVSYSSNTARIGMSPVMSTGTSGFPAGEVYLSFNTGVANSLNHPPGSLIRLVDTNDVFYIDGRFRYKIPNPAIFNAKGFDWNNVIVVSAQEFLCYYGGSDVSETFPSVPKWNGYLDGTLIRQQGTDPVYVISQGVPHWLNITEKEFYSFGYAPSMIHPTSGSIGIVGLPIVASQFMACSTQGTVIKPSPPPPPPPSSCTYTLTPTSQTFTGATGGQGSVAVNTQSGCFWNVQYAPSWFTVLSGSSGNGSGTVSYRVEISPSPNSRGDNVMIAGQVFRVDQGGNTSLSTPAPAPPPTSPPPPASSSCTFSLNPTSRQDLTGALGGTGSISVKTQTGCAWKVDYAPSWFTVLSGNQGIGSGNVSYRVEVSPSANSRGDNIMIAGKTFRVDQGGNTTLSSPTPAPTTNNPSCTFSLNPTENKSFTGAAGGPGTITISTQQGCSWSVEYAPSWFVVTPPTSGTGSSTISYRVEVSPSPNSRGDNVIIAGKVFRVDQGGNVTIH